MKFVEDVENPEYNCFLSDSKYTGVFPNGNSARPEQKWLCECLAIGESCLSEEDRAMRAEPKKTVRAFVMQHLEKFMDQHNIGTLRWEDGCLSGLTCEGKTVNMDELWRGSDEYKDWQTTYDYVKLTEGKSQTTFYKHVDDCPCDYGTAYRIKGNDIFCSNCYLGYLRSIGFSDGFVYFYANTGRELIKDKKLTT